MDKELGIYVHIPFCAGKCAYCDFYSRAGCDELMPEYQRALLDHIRESQSSMEGYLVDTVYFGGGTPSYYGADRLIEIFTALKKYAKVLVESEVTLEANPDSVNYTDLKKLRRAGFNRISIGAQCADDTILKSIGRIHTWKQVTEAVASARQAGFENVSIDLIYGLPSQTREGWADTLKAALNLKPEHFSCYGLKIEEGTPLYPYKDSPFIPDDDAQADMYLYTVDFLERYGYRQYEISNFAKRGYHSRHNLRYWQGKEYLGFGAAAHSYIHNARFSFVSDMKKYAENVESGKSVVDSMEEITDFERAGEYLMLGLRTNHGVSAKEYYDIFPCRFDLCEELMESYRKNGWMVKNEDRWSFTPQGMLLSNVLIGNILETQTKARAGAVAPWKERELAERQFTMFTKDKVETELFNGI